MKIKNFETTYNELEKQIDLTFNQLKNNINEEINIESDIYLQILDEVFGGYYEVKLLSISPNGELIVNDNDNNITFNISFSDVKLIYDKIEILKELEKSILISIDNYYE